MTTLLSIVWGALLLAAKLTLIIIPLVVSFELLRYLPVFRRVGRFSDPFMSRLGFSPQAALPLFTGIFLGIAYGAGIIIRVTQENRLTRAELFLLGLFLGTCHAVVEDTLIFVAIGGNGWEMIGIRLFLAVAITFGLARLWLKRESPPDPPANR